MIICFLLGLSVFSSVCAILRTYEVKNIGKREDPTCRCSPCVLPICDKETTSNVLFMLDSLGILFVYGAAEMWVIIIVSSIPPLYPCFKKWTDAIAPRFSQSAPRRMYEGAEGSRQQRHDLRLHAQCEEQKNLSYIGTACLDEEARTPEENLQSSRILEHVVTHGEWVELK